MLLLPPTMLPTARPYLPGIRKLLLASSPLLSCLLAWTSPHALAHAGADSLPYSPPASETPSLRSSVVPQVPSSDAPSSTSAVPHVPSPEAPSSTSVTQQMPPSAFASASASPLETLLQPQDATQPLRKLPLHQRVLSDTSVLSSDTGVTSLGDDLARQLPGEPLTEDVDKAGGSGVVSGAGDVASGVSPHWGQGGQGGREGGLRFDAFAGVMLVGVGLAKGCINLSEQDSSFLSRIPRSGVPGFISVPSVISVISGAAGLEGLGAPPPATENPRGSLELECVRPAVCVGCRLSPPARSSRAAAPLAPPSAPPPEAPQSGTKRTCSSCWPGSCRSSRTSGAHRFFWGGGRCTKP